LNNIQDGGVGNTAGITIRAGSLSLTNGAQLQSGILGTSDDGRPGGRGNAGNVDIQVRDSVTLAGRGETGLPSAIFTDIESGGEGRGGNINIKTGSFSGINGAGLVVCHACYDGTPYSVLIYP
jgi:hypothetical protein